jgi:hypothetical protein
MLARPPWPSAWVGAAATLTRMDGRTVIDGLGRAAGLLGAARRIVVFSGAGISTDSRIIG